MWNITTNIRRIGLVTEAISRREEHFIQRTWVQHEVCKILQAIIKKIYCFNSLEILAVEYTCMTIEIIQDQ